jgi:hypothetical protein
MHGCPFRGTRNSTYRLCRDHFANPSQMGCFAEPRCSTRNCLTPACTDGIALWPSSCRSPQATLIRRSVLRFFVPDQSPEHAEDTYNDFRAIHNAADKRIRSIAFLDRERQKEVQLCVGQDEPWYSGKILLILLCYPRGYLVFTRDRGIDSGSPIMVQTTDARVEEFDPLDKSGKLSRGA